jgi:hypothetical protein
MALNQKRKKVANRKSNIHFSYFELGLQCLLLVAVTAGLGVAPNKYAYQL